MPFLSPTDVGFFITSHIKRSMDKCLTEIKLHLPEDLKQAIQDAAMEDDRKVSEWIRHELRTLIRLRQSGIRLLDIASKTTDL
jgi:Leu/Phe-tRNA-protein transferase